MGKDKEPKPCAKFDPKNDYLQIHAVTMKKAPTREDLMETLKHASEANWKSGGAAWDMTSDFQKKIEELIGPQPYGKDT